MKHGKWIERLMGGKATGRGRENVRDRRRPDSVERSGRIEAPVWHNVSSNGGVDIRFLVNRNNGPDARRQFTRELKIADIPDLYFLVYQLASHFLTTTRLPSWLEVELRTVVAAYRTVLHNAEDMKAFFEEDPSKGTNGSGK